MTESQVNIKRIKIYLSDPQVLFREGIHFILSGEEDLEVIGEATNNEDAYKQIEANPPNIAILNIQDKKVSGPEITRLIKRKFPSTAVILTIEKKEPEELLEIMKSGASACLLKDIDPENLLEIIRVVAQGSLPVMEELLTPELAQKVLAEFKDIENISEQMENLMAGLTERESQVLSSIAAGSSLEEAATKAGIDEDVAWYNLRLALNKLVANDHIQAIVETVQQGIPSILETTSRTKKLSEEYLTREEFNKFKESLVKRLQNIASEAV
jgi:DNA-binding NarL/FixJ family response regulator